MLFEHKQLENEGVCSFGEKDNYINPIIPMLKVTHFYSFFSLVSEFTFDRHSTNISMSNLFISI